MQLGDMELLRLTGLAMAYHALGKKDESDAALVALIEQDERYGACAIASVLAYRSEADLAFEWLPGRVSGPGGLLLLTFARSDIPVLTAKQLLWRLLQDR